MKNIIFLISLILVFFSGILRNIYPNFIKGKLKGATIEEEETNVYIVTDENFEELLKKFPNLFVKFQAPWCGHCKTLTPEFNKAAKELQEKGINVTFGNIDATIQEKVASRFDIKGYPTLKMFIDGVPVDYEGGRKSEDIIAWIERKLLKKSEEINTVEQLEKIKEEHSVLLVYFGENNHQFKVFSQLAKQFEEIEFFHTFSQEIKDHFNANSIVMFKQFDEKRNDYLEEFDIAKVYEFIVYHSVPTIIEFEQKAVQFIFGEFKPAMIMLLNPEKHQHEYKQFETASLELKDKLILVKCFIDKGYGFRFAEFLGVTDEQLPMVYIVKPVKAEGQDLKKYLLEKEITSENLISFFNDYVEEKLVSSSKSEEIPESNEGPVIKVVGKQFHQIVMDSTKDVLVKYYVPWCQHCKKCNYSYQQNILPIVAPIYTQVAETLKINPNIIIAEYDASANENQEVIIEGYPTVIFYPAKNKEESVKFQGNRIEDDIIAFVKEHASVEWIEPEKKIQEDRNEFNEFEEL